MDTRMLISIPDREALGLLVFTGTINEWVADHSEVLAAISRKIDLFTSGDWGDLDEDDCCCCWSRKMVSGLSSWRARVSASGDSAGKILPAGG